ncbi:MAG: type IV secretory system conjugative DNA transfer family protein [Nocardioides sp.]|jgi:hypothetical protein
MSRAEIAWTRLHLPRPLDETKVLNLLRALASDRRSPDIAFELRASNDGVSHLIGTSTTAVQGVKRLLRDQVPGIAFQAAPERHLAREVGRVELRPRGMPLGIDDPRAVSRALLSAVGTRLQEGEFLVVQVLLGRRRPPRTVSPDEPSPQQSWWSLLTSGASAATSEERRSLRLRAEDAGFDAVIRVGATGTDPERTRRLSVSLHSALYTARGVGVRMDFVHDDPRHLAGAVLPRRRTVELSSRELVGLLGWPLGDDEYPGLPRLHPAPLRPTASVHTGERVFAASLAPGDDRQVGLSAPDGLLHLAAFGPTNSGKSTALLHLIEADMRAGRPVAVLDPKRQLIDDVLARVPKERLDDVVVLDVSRDRPIGFNPLDVTGRDPDVVVEGVLSVFKALFTDGWGARTEDIFSATLRSLTRASGASGSPATLADIPRILTDANFRRSVVGRVRSDEYLAGFWAWYDGQSPQGQHAATSAPLNKLRQFLLRPRLMRMLDQPRSPFRLRDIWRENRVVLVPLNEALIGAGTAEMLGSLIVADLWQAVQERASDMHAKRHPGFVYIDEAPRFLHLPTSVGDALALSRSMGVGWSLAAQFVRQFPKELRDAVHTNARSKIVFGTEYDDATYFARGLRDLGAEDFMSLGRYQAYANLVADGLPSGWALVQTLPPTQPSIRPERVVAHSEQRWASPVEVEAVSPPAQSPTADRPSPEPASTPADPQLALPAGGPPGETPRFRKRRSRWVPG